MPKQFSPIKKNNIMKKNFTKAAVAFMLLLSATQTYAQLSPITFEPNGNGNAWTWTPFENGIMPPPITIEPNPSTTGINTSANVVKMTTRIVGQPYAGFESSHGAGIGTFTLNSTNCIVKLMVYKSVISDVGVKFATLAGASTGEIKKANTLINQWEELTFDFTGKIGEPSSTGIDQIIFFPDFTARTTDNICYIDNVTLGSGTPTQNINVKFAVQAIDSLPVSVFGNWNNWSNYPGTPMVWNASTASYEASLPLTAGSTIEYLYVNGNGASAQKEILLPSMPCTNGNAAYTNRIKVLGTTDVTLCNIYKTCNACTPLSIADNKTASYTISASENFIKVNNTAFEKINAIAIYDMMGKQIFIKNNSVHTNENIAVALLPNTMYVVKLEMNGTMMTTKIIVD
jgi:Secretion system C-terminal sorting domain